MSTYLYSPCPVCTPERKAILVPVTPYHPQQESPPYVSCNHCGELKVLSQESFKESLDQAHEDLDVLLKYHYSAPDKHDSRILYVFQEIIQPGKEPKYLLSLRSSQTGLAFTVPELWEMGSTICLCLYPEGDTGETIKDTKGMGLPMNTAPILDQDLMGKIREELRRWKGTPTPVIFLLPTQPDFDSLFEFATRAIPSLKDRPDLIPDVKSVILTANPDFPDSLESLIQKKLRS